MDSKAIETGLACLALFLILMGGSLVVFNTFGTTALAAGIFASAFCALFYFVREALDRVRKPPRSISRKSLQVAGDVAAFNRIEWAAIEASLAPHADGEVRVEIERLLGEDARLRASLDEVDDVDRDSIEADHLRLRLALDRETDVSTRRALEASFAVCTRRLTSATVREEIRNRIEAHRELILQSLRATGESLARGDSSEIDLDSVRDVAANLASETRAIESAVQEMRAS